MFQKVQNKIIMLMSVIALAMMVGLHLMGKSDEKKIVLLLADQRKEKEMLLNKIIEFKSKSAENFVYDYTFWDDMVDFVKSGDETWAAENIEASIPTFNIDIAWVYKKDLAIVYSTSRTDANHLKRLPLSKDILEKIVSKGPFYHFFMLAGSGLMEIFGASIHPTFDKDRKTPPRGYLFVGCLWTKPYLQEISKLSGAEISLVLPEEEQTGIKEKDLKNFTITNTKALYGWDGKHLINVHSRSEALIAKTLKEQLDIQYWITIVYSIVLLAFLLFILFQLINRPLNLLSKSLADDNPDLIKRLTSQKDEFGNLAVMIKDFFNQKDLLEKDISERKRLEEALEGDRKELKLLIDTSPLIIFYKDKEGRLIRVNKTFAEMLRMSEEDMIGKTVFDLYPHKIAQDMTDDDREVLESNRPKLNIVEQYQSATGLRWVQTDKIPICDNNGIPIGLIGFAQDITDRKLAEEALKKSQEALAKITNSIDDVIYSIDGRTGEFEYLSPVFEKKFGYSLSDIKQMGGRWSFLSQVVEDKDRPQLDPVMNELQKKRKEKTPVWEHQWRCKDGSLLYIEDRSVPVYEGDQLVRIDGVLRDITERRQAEEALRESEEKYRRIVETANEGIWIADRDYKTVYANARLAQMLGYPVEEIVGKSVEFFVFDEGLSAFRQKEKARRRGVSEVYELCLRRKDKGAIWVIVSVTPVRLEDGSFGGAFAMLTDITDRKRAEEALRESEERYRTMIDNSHDLIQSVALNGHFLFVNPHWLRTLGYSKEEVSHLNLFDVIHPDFYPHCREMFKKVANGIAIPQIEVTFIAKNGNLIYLEGNATPRILDGKVIAIQSFFHDVTERKRSEEALRESEKKYSELVNGMNETVWVIDFNGDLIDVNKTAVDVLGYSKEELLKIGLYGIDSSLKKKDIKALAKAMPEDKLQIFETTHTAKNGKMFPVEVYSSLVTYQGKRAILSIARDITERKQAEEALRSVNERLRILHQITETIHESLDLDVLFKRITDAVVKSLGFSTALVLTLDESEEHFCVRSLTSSKLLLTGINTVLGFSLKKLVVPVSEIVEGIKKATRTEDMIIGSHLSDIAHPPLNEPVCNALQKLGENKSYILVPFVLKGKFIGGMIVSSALEQVPKTDIDMLSALASTAVQAIENAGLLSKTNKAKEEIQKSLREKEILLRELYHRTKNNMQVICSMMRLQASRLGEPNTKKIFYEMENKIHSMALVHKKLYESKDLSHLNLKEYFGSLLVILKRSYSELEKQISIRTDMEDIDVLIDTAIPLGLVFNELISNIVKHAFPDVGRGEIKIHLHKTPKSEIVLGISDNGIGLPKGFDIEKDVNLGLETVIDLVKYQLGGKINIKSRRGLHYRITVKENRYKPRV